MKSETKKTETETPKTGRRELLGSGTAAMASMMVGLFAVACKDDDENEGLKPLPTPDAGGVDSGVPVVDSGVPMMTVDSGTPGADAGPAPDRDIAQLNALLAAEYNAIAAYSAGAGLIMAAPTTDPLYALRTVIVEVAVSFQAHHRLHASALVNSIVSLSGTPVTDKSIADAFKAPPALVANPSIMNVLKFATTAERNAAVAYNQVLAGLEDAKFRYLASSIEGDESQHFIVLAALVLGLATPTAKLNAMTAKTVVPKAYVRSIGTGDGQDGLEKGPPNYFV